MKRERRGRCKGSCSDQLRRVEMDIQGGVAVNR